MQTTHDLTPARVPVGELTLHPMNARTHNLPRLMESLKAHGQFAAVVRQASSGFVIKGNGTTKAARALGLDTLDVVTLDVDDDQARRILAIDNKASDDSGYDASDLSALLQSFEQFDGTGYTPDDLTQLLAQIAPTPGAAGDSARLDEGDTKVCPYCEARWRDTAAGPQRVES